MIQYSIIHAPKASSGLGAHSYAPLSRLGDVIYAYIKVQGSPTGASRIARPGRKRRRGRRNKNESMKNKSNDDENKIENEERGEKRA